jgi:hypothetical protein
LDETLGYERGSHQVQVLVSDLVEIFEFFFFFGVEGTEIWVCGYLIISFGLMLFGWCGLGIF